MEGNKKEKLAEDNVATSNNDSERDVEACFASEEELALLAMTRDHSDYEND